VIQGGLRLSCYVGKASEPGSLTGKQDMELVARYLQDPRRGVIVFQESWDGSTPGFSVLEYSKGKFTMTLKGSDGHVFFTGKGTYEGRIWPWKRWDYEAKTSSIDVAGSGKGTATTIEYELSYSSGSSPSPIALMSVRLRKSEDGECEAKLGTTEAIREQASSVEASTRR
jgi:hypothetical protein